jgi:hypothetical protein
MRFLDSVGGREGVSCPGEQHDDAAVTVSSIINKIHTYKKKVTRCINITHAKMQKNTPHTATILSITPSPLSFWESLPSGILVSYERGTDKRKNSTPNRPTDITLRGSQRKKRQKKRLQAKKQAPSRIAHPKKALLINPLPGQSQLL